MCAAITKGYLQREHARTEQRLMAEAEQASREAEHARLLNECNAVVEKRGRRRLSLGPWEFVVWQERFVSATDTGLRYQVSLAPDTRHGCDCGLGLTTPAARPQHVTPTAEPKGKTTEIPYAAMVSIRALSGDMLQVKTAKRDYLFQLSSRDDCERWATNLVTLAAGAGYAVPGFVFDDGSDDEESIYGSSPQGEPVDEPPDSAHETMHETE